MITSRPNKITVANAGERFRFRFRGSHSRPGVAEPERSIHMRTALVLLCACLSTGCVSKSPFMEKAQTQLAALTVGEPDVKFFHSKAALPLSVREQFIAADIGQRFSPGCTGPYSHRRFLAANGVGRTYYVAVEQGGVAYNWFITRYVVDESDKVIEADRIEPDGTANGSQPIRAETNRPSSAAGSRR